MLRQVVYPKIESRLNDIARFLHKKGFTPNQLTCAALGVSFLAGLCYAAGLNFLGGIVLLAGSFGDMVDGALARTSGTSTKFGAFLDSTLDRYSDFFVLSGVAYHFAQISEFGWMLATLSILLGAFVTSYSKARAENFIDNCGVGVFERSERIVTLALGSLIPPLFLWSLVILVFGTNITALHRIIHTRKVLDQTINP